jgi:hypothetical protein
MAKSSAGVAARTDPGRRSDDHLAARDKGYADYYLQAGYGRASMDGFLGTLPNSTKKNKLFEGDANVMSATLGIDALLGNLYGVGIYTSVRMSTGADVRRIETGEPLLTSTGDPVSPSFTGWEVIGFRLLFGI